MTPHCNGPAGHDGLCSRERDCSHPAYADRFVQFGPPTSAPQAKPETVLVNAKPKREKKSGGAKAKNDPKLIAAARELRDRWLEKVNAPGGEGLLGGQGKYEVARLPTAPINETPLLEAA